MAYAYLQVLRYAHGNYQISVKLDLLQISMVFLLVGGGRVSRVCMKFVGRPQTIEFLNYREAHHSRNVLCVDLILETCCASRHLAALRSPTDFQVTLLKLQPEEALISFEEIIHCFHHRKCLCK